MPTDEEKLPEVPLGTFAFTDQIYSSDVDSELAYSDDDTEYTKPKIQESKVLDKPGEELSHEASIWKTYTDEAREHDEELVKNRSATLDMLLLFAALFSAIVTAFLIESKDLLQQDPADTSVALLLLIAQSQHRIELGTPASPATTTEPQIPDFKPSATARWINGIWFSALGLSISSALIAMLGKEWLNAYLASRPRHAHSHALDRQARLEGLNRWWALYIIALLPSLLHMSLLLFSIGLVIYLWTLDKGIAIALLVVVGVTFIFYLATTVLGTVFKYCPFITEISGSARKILMGLGFIRPSINATSLGLPTLKDIQALLWLVDNARDPMAVDCSYQALAGLSKQGTSGPNDLQHNPNTNPTNGHELPARLNDKTTLESLLYTVNNRFQRLSAGSLPSVGNAEVSASRYLNAILGISVHANGFSLLSNSPTSAAYEKSKQQGMLAIDGIDPALEILNTIEGFWHSGNSTLSANAYACILVSSMDIIHHAALNSESGSFEANHLNPANQTGQGHTNQAGTHVVDFAEVPAPPKTTADEQLQTLRAHYSQWLARVSCLLQLYSYTEVTIETDVVNKLLLAITAAARCEILNPIDGISTHHPPIMNYECRAYSFMLHDSSRSYPLQIQKDDLHRGPLGALVELLRGYPAVKDGSSLKTLMKSMLYIVTQ